MLQHIVPGHILSPAIICRRLWHIYIVAMQSSEQEVKLRADDNDVDHHDHDIIMIIIIMVKMVKSQRST